jgi:hypothetical protein
VETDEARQHRCLDGFLARIAEASRPDARMIFDIAWPLHRQLLCAEGDWTRGALRDHMWRLTSIRMQCAEQPRDPMVLRELMVHVIDKILRFEPPHPEQERV